ncbi:MAG: hypothetical protein R3E01_26055 [Pirellulaceae bacterium]
MNRCIRSLMMCLAITVSGVPSAAGQDELGRRATWSLPQALEVEQLLRASIVDRSLTDEETAILATVWDDNGPWQGTEAFDRLMFSLQTLYPDLAPFISQCQQDRMGFALPANPADAQQALPPYIRDNLRLLHGRWLTDQRLYNEALEQLASLDLADVADPAGLLFHRAACHYRLLQKDLGLAELDRLLENEGSLPQRYEVVAKLMHADLEPLKTDSLDEISRLMDSIHVRLGNAHAGKRVRDEEQAVVDKLDKMIEELEQLAQQAMAQAQGQQGGSSPSTPMQDSMPGGTRGPGDVTPKDLGEQVDWGELPPKERQEALQQLGKEFPSHYRDVIEQYFRKLAQDKDSSQP